MVMAGVSSVVAEAVAEVGVVLDGVVLLVAPSLGVVTMTPMADRQRQVLAIRTRASQKQSLPNERTRPLQTRPRMVLLSLPKNNNQLPVMPPQLQVRPQHGNPNL